MASMPALWSCSFYFLVYIWSCSFYFVLHLTVWGVEPVVTHQTSWLESTGVCGVRQNHAVIHVSPHVKQKGSCSKLVGTALLLM